MDIHEIFKEKVRTCNQVGMEHTLGTKCELQTITV